MFSLNKCIFCGQHATDDHFEHLIPESLGGSSGDILPHGLVCKKCNNYFGSKVEQLALASFPFNIWRVFSGIPTKKRKGANLRVIQGLVTATEAGGIVGIDPSSASFDAGIREGRITRMTILAHVTEPLAVCRMMLKMGLEILAFNDPEAAKGPRYDPARHAARAPRRGTRWSFALRANPDEYARHILSNPPFPQSVAKLDVDVSEVVGFPGFDMVHLRWPGIDLVCPLDAHEVDTDDWRKNCHEMELYEVVF